MPMSRTIAVATVLAVSGTALVATGAQAAEPESAGSFDSAQSSLVEVRSSSDTEILNVAGYDGVEIAVGEVASHEAVAPVSFDLNGGSFGEGEEGGIVVFDENGDYLFVVLAEVTDVNGNAVHAQLAPVGEQVTVDLSAADVSAEAYPLDVSVMAASDLIASVTRKSVSQGTTYAVQPSAYGRAAPAFIHVQWGWDEAVRKGVPRRPGLAEQYICHPSSQIARVKSYWNLDTWRPTVGLTRTIAAGCNP
jgi:hypothetical protein